MSRSGNHPPEDPSVLTRPSSQWPATDVNAATADDPSSGLAAFTRGASHLSPASRFDPLAEERAKLQAQAAAVFDVCHAALALRALMLVQVVLAIVALADADTVAEWAARQAALAFGGVAATLLWLVSVCALQTALRTMGASSRAGVVLVLGAAAAGLAWLPLWWAGLAGEAAAGRITAVLLSGAALATLLWAWLDLRARLWHPATAKARLDELQSRIRPHFLFNALNTALALVRIDPARAEAVLEDLAQLFRVALAEVGTSVSLAEEIDLAQRYLAIEELRFGARLAVRWQVDPRVHAARVPSLVLQPLVENAVRHGVEPAAGGGRISIRAEMRRGQVVVEVVNTLPATGAGALAAGAGHGMALHNLRERLRLLHDLQAECDVWREAGTGGSVDRFHARIVLPAP
ncbi:MAG: histidine kinase [Rubrivivax sp.]